MSALLPPMHNGGLSRVVERQMHHWELARSQQIVEPVTPTRVVQDFVAVSRAKGAGGSAAARLLAERLGWPLFDREILHEMAGNDVVRATLYGLMDEHDMTWLEEMIQSASHPAFVRNDYFHRLTETVLVLARKGHAVFLGRATDLILPRGRGFRLRLTAAWQACVASTAREQGVPVETADRAIRRMENERDEFIRHHFHVRADDQSRHDLILNLSTFTPQEAVELTLAAMRMKGILKAEHS